MQFIVDPSKLAIALQLVGGETETGQHYHENQTVPELQTPLDGFEEFHAGQLPVPLIKKTIG